MSTFEPLEERTEQGREHHAIADDRKIFQQGCFCGTYLQQVAVELRSPLSEQEWAGLSAQVNRHNTWKNVKILITAPLFGTVPPVLHQFIKWGGVLPISCAVCMMTWWYVFLTALQKQKTDNDTHIDTVNATLASKGACVVCFTNRNEKSKPSLLCAWMLSRLMRLCRAGISAVAASVAIGS